MPPRTPKPGPEDSPLFPDERREAIEAKVTAMQLALALGTPPSAKRAHAADPRTGEIARDQMGEGNLQADQRAGLEPTTPPITPGVPPPKVRKAVQNMNETLGKKNALNPSPLPLRSRGPNEEADIHGQHAKEREASDSTPEDSANPDAQEVPATEATEPVAPKRSERLPKRSDDSWWMDVAEIQS